MSDARGLKSFTTAVSGGGRWTRLKKQHRNGSTLPQHWADSQVYYCCGCRAAPAISGHALGVSKECRCDTMAPYDMCVEPSHPERLNIHP